MKSTILQNLQTIKTQKNAIKTAISALGFDVQSLPLSGYAEKINQVNEERVEIKNVLSSAGIDVSKPLSDSINDTKNELVRLSGLVDVFLSNDLSDHEAVSSLAEITRKYGELSTSYDNLSGDYDLLSAEYQKLLSDEQDIEEAVEDILGV